MSVLPLLELDVLCIGHASYDLVFSLAVHPQADEKTVADGLLACGGGPAANAAVMVSKLGLRAGFCGYLGQDVYGDSHLLELSDQQVDASLVVRGLNPTPLSAVLVKPDGKRALINYKGATCALPADSVDFSRAQAKVVLFDGHEAPISLTLLQTLQGGNVPTLLDAGSWHDGTRLLMDKVDYLVCSEKFATQFSGDAQSALQELAAFSPAVVITLGERGLIWRRGQDSGVLAAPPLTAIDTTGAGDAFHGAFAAGLAINLSWPDLLAYASAAGGLCCTQLGARTGLPERSAVLGLLGSWATGFDAG